jgi:MFS family permease
MNHTPAGSQHFWKYLIGQPSRQVRELLVSTTILDFAIAAIALFEPIYLWKLGFSVPEILLFYLGIYALYLVLQPLGGKVTRSQGYKHGIVFSTPFLILYYLSLFAIPYSPLFIIAAMAAFAINKTLYWPGFHADFARFGSPAERGRELGVLVLLLSLASVAGPFFGGFVIMAWGFPALFVIVALLILASNIPLLLTPEVFVPRELSYLDAYKRLLKPENRRLVIAYVGYGEELLATTIWPIFMFLAIGSFEAMGAIVSLGVLFTAAIGYFVGHRTDCGSRMDILRSGTLLTSLSWLMRIAVTGVFPIWGIDTLYRASRMAQGMPMIVQTYDLARRYSVTKTALLIEMAVIVGKISIGLAAIAAFVWLGQNAWTATFVLAAGYSLLYLAYRSPECPVK